jgi:tRNA (adenine22-N1)-methyltransferase
MLTPRLLTIAQMVKPGTVADIGADHALLAVHLVMQQVAPRAIVTDIHDGPLARAAQTVRAHGLSDYIQVRRGDGLKPLACHEVDTIIIAGMGGTVINDIITADWDKSESFSSYIFQPMTKPEILRAALADRGWPILAEEAVLDRGKWYVIMLSRPDRQPYILNDLQLEAGPQIMAADTQPKRDYLLHWRNKYVKVCESLFKSNQPENTRLSQIYKSRITCLEELLSETQG